LCLVVNPASGVSEQEITLEAIVAASRSGAKTMLTLLHKVLAASV